MNADYPLARELFAEIWRALGGDAVWLDRVRFHGDGVLPSPFAVTDFAAATLAAAGSAVGELLEAAGTAQNGGYLELPVLFLAARYDPMTASTHSRAAEPMRSHCRQLTEATIRAGHWLAQEKPVEVNAALVQWLATSVPQVWPQPK